MSSPTVVVGIDVGGPRKGFHAVALRGGVYREQFVSRDPDGVVAWCRDVKARVVAVDAPCQWNTARGAREAERKLMQEKIWCFSTPTRSTAEAHPTGHYTWMQNGMNLFGRLQNDYELFDGLGVPATRTLCLETFPHAVVCALKTKVIPARNKASVRRSVLDHEGVDTKELKSIDRVDAALCALAAHYFAKGKFRWYGERATGFIVVPSHGKAD